MQVWFSPHGTEWSAETYEEALEMERDALVDQLQSLDRDRRTAMGAAERFREQGMADAEERDRLKEQLQSVEAERTYFSEQTDAMFAQKVDAEAERNRLKEQLQSAEQERKERLDEKDDFYGEKIVRLAAERDGLQEQLEAAERVVKAARLLTRRDTFDMRIVQVREDNLLDALRAYDEDSSPATKRGVLPHSGEAPESGGREVEPSVEDEQEPPASSPASEPKEG